MFDVKVSVNNTLKEAFLYAISKSGYSQATKRLTEIKIGSPIFIENVGMTFVKKVDKNYNFVLSNGTKIDFLTALHTKYLTVAK